jgi:pimeloyl-ACP methyl ester carboxylesterase
MSEILPLPTGAEMRLTNPASETAVVCINGGQGGLVEGTWSASLEWLVEQLAPSRPAIRFAEVRYRIKSWRKLDWCIEDARSAIEQTGGTRTLLVGFSMGGAVGIGAADAATVEGLVGLAPWIPDRMPVDTLVGRRFDVIHGSLDRWLPGIPGVSTASSRRGFDRIQALGVPGTYTLIPGAVHPIALRRPNGIPFPFPRARRWAELVGERIDAFASATTA